MSDEMLEDSIALTQEEKMQLTKHIDALPPNKIDRVISIIQERVWLPGFHDKDQELEIEVDSLPTPTLRALQRYVGVSGGGGGGGGSGSGDGGGGGGGGGGVGTGDGDSGGAGLLQTQKKEKTEQEKNVIRAKRAVQAAKRRLQLHRNDNHYVEAVQIAERKLRRLT